MTIGHDDVVAVDCRFDLGAPHAGFHAYLDGHVPGARYAHLDKDLARRPLAHEGRHPLPNPSDFIVWLECMGIAADTRVVVYDDIGGAIAARLWWMLEWIGHPNCRILDGGLAAWRSSGGELHNGLPAWAARRYDDARPRSDNIVTTAELADHLARGALLVDARAAPRYRGEVEPIDPVAGHVPGARNLPFSELLDANGCFESPSTLAELLSSRGDAASGELIAMCGSGVTACHVLAARRIAGRGDGLLYVGSWSEWIRDPTRPVETA